MDVQEIDGASNRGVDDVRELRENIKYTFAEQSFSVPSISIFEAFKMPYNLKIVDHNLKYSPSCIRDMMANIISIRTRLRPMRKPIS